MTDFSKELIPILSSKDQRAGIAKMEQIFGFVCIGVKGDLGTLMALGDQKILIAPNLNAIGSIRPHHVALSVPDTDDAMNACMARGEDWRSP